MDIINKLTFRRCREQARFLEQVRVRQHVWKAAKAVECFAEVVWGTERSAGMKTRCGG